MRLALWHNADRILVLHSGRVVESGTHEELIAPRGRYNKLHQMQFLQDPEGV